MRFLLPVLLLACFAESEDTDSAPAPVDPAFTLVVLPDTQYLSLDPDNGVLDRMMDQILDLAEEEHVAMVLQEGDLTHDNTEAGWIAMDETTG